MFSKLTHQTPKSRNKYMLKYNPNLGWFEITGFSFPKTSSDDGGAPGVSVEWYEMVEAESEGQLEVIGNIYENPYLLKP